MPLPALTKTWQLNVNNAIAAQGSQVADNRALLLAIKNALKGFGSSPWTVSRSSDSVSSGTSDLWVAGANLVWANAGVAHSWIVLKQTGISAGYEVCIDLNFPTANGNILSIIVSASAGFTGGTTTNRPTATDEIVLINAAAFTTLTADQAYRWSVSQSTDGQCTRIWHASGGSVTGYMIFDKASNPATGWTTSNAQWAGTAALSATNLCGNYNGRSRINAVTSNMVMLVPSGLSIFSPTDVTWGNIANEVSSEWPMYPITLASNTVGARGIMGGLFDMWIGSSAVPNADTYPGDASNQFVQLSNLIMPWNGGPVNLT